MIKYCLHPGQVTSKHDGQLHYVGYNNLVALYGVDPKECTTWSEVMDRDGDRLIHLYPRYDGEYSLSAFQGYGKIGTREIEMIQELIGRISHDTGLKAGQTALFWHLVQIINRHIPQ